MRVGTAVAVALMMTSAACSDVAFSGGAAPSDEAAVAGTSMTRPSPTITSGDPQVGSTVQATTEPATTASTTSTASTIAPRADVVIGIAGDSTFTNGLETRDPFGQVTAELQAPDLMVINLETAVADPGVGRPPVDKAFLFLSPPESLDLLTAAGIDAVTLGNNHALDFGPAALEQTLDELDARGILRVGAGRTEAEAYEPLIVPVGDWTVGLVSLSRVPCDWSASGENTREQIGWACPPFADRIDAAVLAAVDQADVTIVMAHGGEEGVLCPSPFMVELTQHFADLGADAVVNGHPHVLQGLGRHGDTLVAYSTGNFAFPPAGGISGNSAIVTVEISESGVTMGLVPMRSEGGVLRPPTDTERAAILDQVNRYSNGVRVDDEGTALADPSFVGECGPLG